MIWLLGTSACIGACLALAADLAFEQAGAWRAACSRLWGRGLALRLEEVSIQVSTHRLAAGVGAAAIFGGLAAGLLAGAAAFLPGCLLGLGLPYALLFRLKVLRWRAFQSQLPESLDLLAGALRSGQSLPQAFGTLGREAPSPSREEWGGVVNALSLGVPAEDALESLASRHARGPAGVELALVATAVSVQRSVGGNLAETFARLSESVRERVRLKEQVGALTAQGRLSGWVIGLLPVFLLLVLQLLEPDLVRPLFTTPAGWAILGAGLALEAMGAFFIRRTVAVEF